MSKIWTPKQKGFTIVELLIVIVVIGILAAITIVAFSSIQQRGRDAQRKSDAVAATKALEIYKISNDSYPATAPNPGSSGFEVSTNPGFLGALSPYLNGVVFKDPINTGASSYWYHRFGAGEYGCPAAAGPYYVFWIRGMEAQDNPEVQSSSCPGYTLFVTTPAAGAWTIDKTDRVIFGF